MQATPFWPLHGTQAGLPPSGWCDLPQSLLPWVLTHAQKPGRCMAASAATARLAVGSRSGVLRLVQAAAPRLPVVARVRLFAGPVAALAWGPGAQLLAAVSGDARRGPAYHVLSSW